ncbi:hypothetical protein Nepgr_013922 [Nepenthes gracilis]|uniref:Uncharacterized protein n=1 Tax=Nepenthes gracilis TaxID=150966 RepID=A0AAD3SK15_NEPGR|nr:hypothetical protein Nepgr_013922 [Nepenthes gracilis]
MSWKSYHSDMGPIHQTQEENPVSRPSTNIEPFTPLVETSKGSKTLSASGAAEASGPTGLVNELDPVREDTLTVERALIEERTAGPSVELISAPKEPLVCPANLDIGAEVTGLEEFGLEAFMPTAMAFYFPLSPIGERTYSLTKSDSLFVPSKSIKSKAEQVSTPRFFISIAQEHCSSTGTCHICSYCDFYFTLPPPSSQTQEDNPVSRPSTNIEPPTPLVETSKGLKILSASGAAEASGPTGLVNELDQVQEDTLTVERALIEERTTGPSIELISAPKEPLVCPAGLDIGAKVTELEEFGLEAFMPTAMAFYFPLSPIGERTHSLTKSDSLFVPLESIKSKARASIHSCFFISAGHEHCS